MIYLKQLLGLSVFTLLLASCARQVTAPAPMSVVPTERQIEWFDTEYYGFIHFGPNTFTGNEWGHGDEDPNVFDPQELDTDQWARVMKEAGMKGVVLTAKHHDGFCLWPSKQSTHTVSQSKWRDGGGDIVKMLSESCKKYGLKFGIYLSPWDMNHPDFTTPKYNDAYIKTIEEVLTNYGEIFEFWYDGGDTGKNGKKQIYDWDRFDEKIRQLQPGIVINGCRDLRWVGNEEGYAPETCWAMMDKDSLNEAESRKDGSVLTLYGRGVESGDIWAPAECDVSIRPGWFYRPGENSRVKSVEQLFDIYMGSVGRNATLILNVPPDRRGLIPETEARRLKQLREHIEECFRVNLALGTKVTATNSRSTEYSAAKAINNNCQSYWATEDSVTRATLTFEWSTPQTINAIMLQEYISLGQRIQKFDIETLVSGEWKMVANGTTVGHKRILRFDDIETTRLRINITDSRAAITLSNIGIYNFPQVITTPAIERTSDGMLTMSTTVKNSKIHYTMDGEEPTASANLYTGAFSMPKAGVIKAKLFDERGVRSSETIEKRFDIIKSRWLIVGCDSQQESGYNAENAIDDNGESIWMSGQTKGVSGGHPHHIVVDLAEEYTLKGFTYLPRQDGSRLGNISQYSFYVSLDGEQWECMADHRSFNNIANNPIFQEVYFERMVPARYIKLETHSDSHSLEDSESLGVASIAEMGVITSI